MDDALTYISFLLLLHVFILIISTARTHNSSKLKAKLADDAAAGLSGAILVGWLTDWLYSYDERGASHCFFLLENKQSSPFSLFTLPHCLPHSSSDSSSFSDSLRTIFSPRFLPLFICLLREVDCAASLVVLRCICRAFVVGSLLFATSYH